MKGCVGRRRRRGQTLESRAERGNAQILSAKNIVRGIPPSVPGMVHLGAGHVHRAQTWRREVQGAGSELTCPKSPIQRQREGHK